MTAVADLMDYGDVLARFTRAAAKGWQYTHQNPEKAVDLLVKAYPNLDRDAELDAIRPQVEAALRLLRALEAIPVDAEPTTHYRTV